MDVQNLKQNHSKLINHMKEMDYSQNYIQQIRREIKILLESPNNWMSYEDFIKSYRIKYVGNHKEFIKKKAIINLIARFDLNGILPRDLNNLKTHNRLRGAYEELNLEYRGLIDFYHNKTGRNKKKESTILNECRNTSSFLLKLQKKGIVALAAINQDSILDLLVGADGYPVKSASYVTQINAVFKGSLDYNDECKRIAAIIPIQRKHRKNIQYLNNHERNSIRGILSEDFNKLSYRDKAIGCLLYYYGLRCSDISNIKLEDIDWDKEQITIIQQKTEIPITIPLTPTVGNVIYDYITLERRKSDCDYIFLSLSFPFRKMTPKTVGASTYKLFKIAGIRQSRNDRRGAHIFRHNLATSMLENGVPRAVISRILGHTSCSSTDMYISADMVHLKEFALSVEPFPVREGAFKNERV